MREYDPVPEPNLRPPEPEPIPWCEECEKFSVPLEDGRCGVCGGRVRFR